MDGDPVYFHPAIEAELLPSFRLASAEVSSMTVAEPRISGVASR